jgi:hypothetical protein
MQCLNCGNVLSQGDQFCGNCGFNLTVNPPGFYSMPTIVTKDIQQAIAANENPYTQDWRVNAFNIRRLLLNDAQNREWAESRTTDGVAKYEIGGLHIVAPSDTGWLVTLAHKSIPFYCYTFQTYVTGKLRGKSNLAVRFSPPMSLDGIRWILTDSGLSHEYKEGVTQLNSWHTLHYLNTNAFLLGIVVAKPSQNVLGWDVYINLERVAGGFNSVHTSYPESRLALETVNIDIHVSHTKLWIP